MGDRQRLARHGRCARGRRAARRNADSRSPDDRVARSDGGAGIGDNPNGAGDRGDTGGCGCHATSAEVGGDAAFVLAIAALGFARRRRRSAS
ncbi:MAG: MYXO-CTERM sorting domain-containing protein [Polyangiaceae bacterium]